MVDKLGRNIEYLRISVTQNCNLKCIYCTSGDSDEDNSRYSLLKPEDYGSITAIAASLGIRKVRITGGEPLLRPDICQIVSAVSGIGGIGDISMTTNGVHLEAMAQELKNAGLTRVNISLDSLNEDGFARITGARKLQSVLKGIDKAIAVGLAPVRTNTVLIKGLNDTEIDDFIELARDRKIDVRFIELMPIGRFGEENRDKMIFNSDIIAAHPGLTPIEQEDASQPAIYYRLEGYKGRIGFISPISHRFCDRCNRMRLTCDGKLIPCLGNTVEVDILELLGDPAQLRDAMSRSIYEKPSGHCFNDRYTSRRKMVQIGG